MHKRARVILPIVLLLIIGGGIWWWFGGRGAPASGHALTGSGTIEADEMTVVAEISAKVKDLPVEEGQDVRAGQTLAVLDRSMLDAQFAQAQAGVQAANANLALLQAGARTEDITQAQAAVAQAQAARDGATQAYANAQTIAANPQDLNAQIAQAQANRDAAQQQLNKVRAGSRDEDLAVAQSTQEQAQANLQATRDRLSAAKTQAETQVTQAAQALTQTQARSAQAQSNWQYVQDTGNDPINPVIYNQQTGKKLRDNKLSADARGTYYSQYVQAEAAMHSAKDTVAQAKVAADAARRAEVTGIQTVEQQIASAEANLARTQNGATSQELAIAQTNVQSAQRTLDTLKATRANPEQLRASVDNAKAQLSVAEAQVAQAQARLEAVQAGSRPEQIQVARAQLAQAQASQQQVAVQVGRALLTAPQDGLVLSRAINLGELAAPGAPLMTIGALDTVKLTVYVAEGQIGRVKQGQMVHVTVDAFPGRVFNGTVAFIAGKAEFTPRNVQTQDERATTVFAVRAELPNADHALKPGMPADAAIVE